MFFYDFYTFPTLSWHFLTLFQLYIIAPNRLVGGLVWNSSQMVRGTNENVTPRGSPALVKPINSGIDEQEQNGVTVPSRAAIIFAPIP